MFASVRTWSSLTHTETERASTLTHQESDSSAGMPVGHCSAASLPRLSSAATARPSHVGVSAA